MSTNLRVCFKCLLNLSISSVRLLINSCDLLRLVRLLLPRGMFIELHIFFLAAPKNVWSLSVKSLSGLCSSLFLIGKELLSLSLSLSLSHTHTHAHAHTHTQCCNLIDLVGTWPRVCAVIQATLSAIRFAPPHPLLLKPDTGSTSGVFTVLSSVMISHPYAISYLQGSIELCVMAKLISLGYSCIVYYCFCLVSALVCCTVYAVNSTAEHHT